jgi:hypothetical protein
MSTEKTSNNEWGGARQGSGRGAGDKTKICVSVDEENWQSALSIWKKRPSWLVDNLIADYIAGNGGIQETEAI